MENKDFGTSVFEQLKTLSTAFLVTSFLFEIWMSIYGLTHV